MKNWLLWLRRLSQLTFLLLTITLIFVVGHRSGAEPNSFAAQSLGAIFRFDPLTVIATSLASRALVPHWWWSLAILAPTIFLGRFFCGWICPLGTLHQAASAVARLKRKPRQLMAENTLRFWLVWKYVLLAALLAASLLGSAALLFTDPITLLLRSFGLSAAPALHGAGDSILSSLEDSPLNIFQYLGAQLHDLWSGTAVGAVSSFFRQNTLFAVILALTLLANVYVTRFWCRALCPLGALLGVFGRWSPLKLKRTEQCNRCGLCQTQCQGGDNPSQNSWRKQECLFCLNCVEGCPKNSISFDFVQIAPAEDESIAPSQARRRLLLGAGAGLALVPVLRTSSLAQQENNPHLLRPPGARAESDFLSRCIRCGACIRSCPTNTLQPALWEGGLEGLWTPLLAPRVGACAVDCVLCSQLCPTEAIAPLTAQEKGWRSSTTHPVRLGTAFFDHGRCAPWSMGIECGACERACPVTPKAIYMEESSSITSSGAVVPIHRPHLNPALCVGCGSCEHACPVHDHPAVTVSSIGESRATHGRFRVNGQDLGRRKS